jgi:hypothetical protein
MALDADYPPILQRLIQQLKDKGYDDKRAEAVAISSLQRSGNLFAGTTKPTTKGVERGLMSPADRAMDREVLGKGKNPLDYEYNPITNKMNKRK